MFEPRWPPRPDTEERQAINDVLASRTWTGGPWTEAVEQRLRNLTGAPHAIAFNSCTSALHAALHAMGCHPGYRVALPAFTFAGTATGAVHIGARLQFHEIDPNELTLEDIPSESWQIVIAVDLHGVPHRLDRSRADLLTDACQSLGTTNSIGEHLGAVGTHAWSFSAAKLVAAPDGGAITTDNHDLAQRLYELRDYGTDPGSGQPRAVRPVHLRGGHNWRPSEVTMALVAHRLRHLEQWAHRAHAVTGAIHDALDRAGIWRQHTPEYTRPAWHKIRLGPVERAPHLADHLERVLATAGIPTHWWGHPLYQMPAFAPYEPTRLPTSEAVATSSLCLGTEACPPLAWTDDEIDHVLTTLEKF